MQDEARIEEWADRAKRFTQHALYHMDVSDPIPDLEAAIVCMRIADRDVPESEMDDAAVPGNPDYACHMTYGRDCGYRVWS